MDKALLGRRLADARTVAGMSEAGVGRIAGLEREEVIALEKGERGLRVPELVRVAEALGRPLSFFVEPAVPAVVSRRASDGGPHDSTLALDVELDQFAIDVRSMLDLDLLTSIERPRAQLPRTHADAEAHASHLREQIDAGSSPIDDLGRACEALGLVAYAAALGVAGPDGACIEVEGSRDVLGAAVINGDAPPGRRRMTLAHELGHWVFGDAYDAAASRNAEKMINSFAIHFLAPRAGVSRVWNERQSWPLRDRAMAVGVEFRLSWSATIAHLRNVETITRTERDLLEGHEPRAGDYLRLQLKWQDELERGYISPGFIAGCLQGYAASVLTAERTLELLRGQVGSAELPDVEPRTRMDLRRSFVGHVPPASSR